MQSIVVAGIDVSKEKLDVAIFNGKKFTLKVYGNTKEGIEKLISDVEHERLSAKEKERRLIKEPEVVESNADKVVNAIESIHFVMEATGSYHTKALYALSKQNYPVYVLNPIISKRYGEEQLKRTITDKEASKALAMYTFSSISNHILKISSENYNTLLSFKFNPSNEDDLKLKILTRALEGLMKTKTRILNQIEGLNQYAEGYAEETVESLKRLLKEIEKEIKNIQDKIDEIINNNEENKDLYRRLTSIPGIGNRTAGAIIAYFGSFSSFNSPRQVASFVGLTPSIKESGKSVKKNGYSISKIGNPYLRQMLFMASLSASKNNNQYSILYDRLLKEGKNKKLILIAVAHKLLRQAFAVAKYGRVYDPSFEFNTLDNTINTEEKQYKERKHPEKQKELTYSIFPPYLQDKIPNITDY